MDYLRAYCDQLIGVGRDETLLMRFFNQSLCEEALEWFRMKPGNGPAGMHWPMISLMDLLTT